METLQNYIKVLGCKTTIKTYGMNIFAIHCIYPDMINFKHHIQTKSIQIKSTREMRSAFRSFVQIYHRGKAIVEARLNCINNSVPDISHLTSYKNSFPCVGPSSERNERRYLKERRKKEEQHQYENRELSLLCCILTPYDDW